MIDAAARDTGSSNEPTNRETDEDKVHDRRKPGATGNAGSETGRGAKEARARSLSGADHLGARDLDKLTEEERSRNLRN